MVCDGARSMFASQTHLKGAATLVKLRGKSQFSTLVGHGMFVRLRGSIVRCCPTRFPLSFSYHVPRDD